MTDTYRHSRHPLQWSGWRESSPAVYPLIPLSLMPSTK